MAYDPARLEQALINADKAGDTEAAKMLAAEIRKMRATPELEPTEPRPLLQRAAGGAAEVMARMAGQPFTANLISQVTGPSSGRPWSEVLPEAVTNAPKSLGHLAGGLANMVIHPLDTAKTVLDLAAGGLQNVLPQSVVEAVNKLDWNPEASAAAREKANQVGKFYADRYGSAEGFKQAVAKDPAGVMLDLASIFTLGGGTMARIGGLTGVPALTRGGQVVSQVGRAIDPIALTAKGAIRAVHVTGRGLANVIGGLGTHTGPESIRQATRAGLEGGERAETFTRHLRGNAPMEEPLEVARQALRKMREARGQVYRGGMEKVSADKTVLDFKPILDSMDDVEKIGSYKGKVLDASTRSVKTELGKLIDDWAKSNPADFHTPEGLDALKRAVGDIRDSAPFGTPSRKVADTVYHAVREQITRQAPTYANVMSRYEQASEQLREIEKALSLGKNANADTALRKLQSLMRDNVNTNYGGRLKRAGELEQYGAENLMPALAGQALKSLTPRGLGKIGGGLGTGAAAFYLTGDPVTTVATLLAQSPRLMGESAYKIGQGARVLGRGSSATAQFLDRIGVDPALLANLLTQAGQERRP